MSRAEHPASSSASRAKPQVESAGTLAEPEIVKDAVERLLDVFDSGVVETTVAVLTTGTDMRGLTTTSTTVAEPPAATVPREQLTGQKSAPLEICF